MSTPDPQAAAARAVELQRNYLRNPLPPGEGICRTCRSNAGPGFQYCYPCSRHRSAANGRLADLVVPVAYSVKGTQHAHNLIVYKAVQPSTAAQYNLSALGLLFLSIHWSCLTGALRGGLTHVATVPSTRGRQGPHPLETILASRLGLPAVACVPNAAYTNEDRDFHQDRFAVVTAVTGARVLLLDDTWTTGARVQSVAFALKQAGAVAVVAVVLGRHVNPQYDAAGPFVARLRDAGPFDLNRCALDDAPGR